MTAGPEADFDIAEAHADVHRCPMCWHVKLECPGDTVLVGGPQGASEQDMSRLFALVASLPQILQEITAAHAADEPDGALLLIDARGVDDPTPAGGDR